MSKSATQVNVVQSTEPWAEFILADGSIIRAKFTFSSALRKEGEFTPDGMPVYQFMNIQVFGVVAHADPSLCNNQPSGNA